MRISAFAISSRASAWPSSERRSTATEYLLRAITRHQLGLSPWPQLRIWSPVTGGSSLTISAPISPSNWPQKGPAISCPISTTLMPSSAPPLPVSLISFLSRPTLVRRPASPMAFVYLECYVIFNLLNDSGCRERKMLKNHTVELVEVGPRDGLQNEAAIIATADKLALIRRAIDYGARRIEVTSFVNPKKVPQLADAEELVAMLPEREDVPYIGLVLNRRGHERAPATGRIDDIDGVCVERKRSSLNSRT